MILDEIVEKTRLRVKATKRECPLIELKLQVQELPLMYDFPFERALQKDSIAFILEVKKASPSKGEIVADFDYLNIAREYEQLQASAISVLTEPDFFKGSNAYLREIAKQVSLPVLRKDFIVDEYMIYEAKKLGASAVLLICKILSEKTLEAYIELAHSLGLSCLVEAHNHEEVTKAIAAGARVIGVNNRNLSDFSVDIKNSIRLRQDVPKNILFVSESGIRTREQVQDLEAHDVNAVLIGETLMRATDKKQMLDVLRGE